MSNRKDHIEVLDNLLSHYKAREKCEGYYDSTLKDNIEALHYAINSLKVDELYQLEYEKALEQASTPNHLKEIYDAGYQDGEFDGYHSTLIGDGREDSHYGLSFKTEWLSEDKEKK